MEAKEEILKELVKEGYNAKLENGVVMLYYKTKEEYKTLSSEIKDKLHSLNYYGSYGIKGDTNKNI